MKLKDNSEVPNVIDASKVGEYELKTNSGGGFFYDDVLEYRVWYKDNSESYCYCTAVYDDAVAFYNDQPDGDLPVVLVKQLEYVIESKTGNYKHIKKPRMTEWRIEWLKDNKGSKKQIPLFLKSKKQQDV